LVLHEVFNENVYDFTANANGLAVIDVGANIGIFSIYAAMKGAKVVAIEPEPHNIELFKKNVELNNLQNKIKLYEFGIGEPGTYRIKNNAGGSSIVGYIQENYDKENKDYTQIEVKSLDKIEFDNCDFMKVDIEGAEYDMFESCNPQTLKKIKQMSVEFHVFDKLRHQLLLQQLSGIFEIKQGRHKDVFCFFRK